MDEFFAGAEEEQQKQFIDKLLLLFNYFFTYYKFGSKHLNFLAYNPKINLVLFSPHLI